MTGRLGLAVAVVWAVMWVSGSVWRAARKPLSRRSNTAAGAGLAVRAAVSAWRRPGRAVSGAAVCVIAAAAVAAAAAWATRPALRPYIAVCGTAATLLTAAVWDFEQTAGGPWRDVLARRRRADQLRAAVIATHPDARPGKIRVDGETATIEVDHVDLIDPERFGRAVHAPHAELVGTGLMGVSRIDVHASRPGWDRWRTVHPWPGPHSRDADAPIPVGVDVDGTRVWVPRPGVGGQHLLVAGATGAGKSDLLSVIIAELAHRPDVDLWLADPKWVELGAWETVAWRLAKGDVAVEQLLAAFDAEMMSRYRQMETAGVREWSGRRGVLVVDELAGLLVGPAKTVAPRVAAINKLLSMARAAQLGIVLCTQRPSTRIIPADLRDNCRFRIGLGMESADGTEMIMGSADLARRYPCDLIPEDLPGVGWLRHGRTATLFRGYHLDDLALAAAVTSAAGARHHTSARETSWAS